MGGKGSGQYPKGHKLTPEEYKKSHSPAVLARHSAVDPDENARVIDYSLALMEMPKVDRADPEAVFRRGVEFFDACSRFSIRPNVAGMAVAYGMSRVQFSNLVNQNGHLGTLGTTKETLGIMQRFYSLLNANLEASMLDDKGNPVKYIFLAKNNFGYTDQHEQVVTRKDPAEGLKSPEEVAAKYADIVDAEVVEPEELPEGSGKDGKAPERGRRP